MWGQTRPVEKSLNFIPSLKRLLGHLAPENWNRTNIVVRLAVLGALGRAEEARTTVDTALARYPDLSIEGHVSSPEFNDTERRSYIEALRAAGLRPSGGRPLPP